MILLMFHTCCKTMFQWFHLFQSYVVVSVFMLQVASVLSGCCIYFHTYVASVYYRCFIYFRRMLHSSASDVQMYVLQAVFHVDVAKVNQDIAYVASISETCCKRLFKMLFRLFLSIFYLDVAYVSHMLQEYVPMVSVVSVLCFDKCFHVASCKCFI